MRNTAPTYVRTYRLPLGARTGHQLLIRSLGHGAAEVISHGGGGAFGCGRLRGSRAERVRLRLSRRARRPGRRRFRPLRCRLPRVGRLLVLAAVLFESRRLLHRQKGFVGVWNNRTETADAADFLYPGGNVSDRENPIDRRRMLEYIRLSCNNS